MSEALTLSELEELEAITARQEWLTEHNKIDQFEPYAWQRKLFNKYDANGELAMQRLAMCANRVGKTFGGAAETSYHLTGRYPDWWDGHRFEKPILAWVCGVSSDTTRDILQTALLGDPEGGEDSWGTGAIPVDCLDWNKKIVKRGATTGTLYSVQVKHVSGGWSTAVFKAYEQGVEKYMGKSVNFIILDEEPSSEIYTQCITRTADNDGLVLMTFTPESGMTSVVNQFLNDIKPGQKLVQATWADVDHLNERTKEQLLAQYTPAERDMRSRGIPIFGSGLVFPVLEGGIPDHWAKIAGIDFGYDHPTAVVWIAYDPDQDTVYVYDCYRKSKENVIAHAAAIRARGQNVPVAFPHDGMQHDKGSGKGLAQQYRDEGVNMLHQHFTNPPVEGDKAKQSGKGNINVEPGIAAMLKRMETGRFKVYSTCPDWFAEYRLYHRKDGKIVALDDDLMSATRYAHQMLRFAQKVSTGGSRMDSAPIKYDTRGIV
jgi:phage terminase large subunit-like protein